MLNFVGIGSAFNPEDGNTSAYLMKNNHFYLIDCGGLVFKELVQQINFKKITAVHIFITHTHADHVGSLGTLISYLHHQYSLPVYVYHAAIGLAEFLNQVGVSANYYEEVTDQKNSLEPFTFEWVETEHSDQIKSFGLLLEYDEERVWYSGDAKNIPERVYDDFMNDKIGRIYQDVSIDSANTAHMTLEKLKTLIPESKRQQVIAMHLEEKAKEKIEAAGFKTANRATK